MKTLWDHLEEQEVEKKPDPAEMKKLKIEQERQEVLDRVSSHTLRRTTQDRVAWILNYYPETRDSDITLQLKYWEVFESHIYNGHSVKPDDLYRLTRLTTLRRARAKLQNEYKLFLASPEIRQRRGKLAEEEKEKAVEDKPGPPVFIVYMDDSGKTTDYLIIASVWFLADFPTIFQVVRDVRRRKDFEREFHFKELKRADLPIYEELVDILLAHANVISFKLISVPRAGLGNVSTALTNLYYHLLVRGIEHEHETGRAPLPRKLQVWIDAEEAGLDRLRLATLDNQLRQAAHLRFNQQLVVDQLHSVDSKENLALQVADLLAGSATRILSRSGTKHTHKDEFAEYLFSKIGMDLDLPQNDQVADMAVHISL